ncbi:MAG: SIS domain-containing protein [Clostridia bacterium]|nr:SIS domain-containing protein [Clostridia bacterium]
MKASTQKILEELVEKYPQLQDCFTDIEKAFLLLKSCFENGGRVFTCGNGGSSADSEHIVGELLKSFKKYRPIDKKFAENLQAFGADGAYLCEKLEGSLPAYSLNSQTGVMTAFANDKSWDATFAQQLYGLGSSGDCLLTMSTSGNSKNCLYAVLVGKAKGISSIALTGTGGGKLKTVADCTIAVPETETYKVQELHLPVYHCLCAMLEEEFF